MSQENDLSEQIKTVDHFHDLLFGGIRVKAFKKLILLDSHLRVKYPKVGTWAELKLFKREPGVRYTYSNYLSLACADKKEINYCAKWLGVSERTMRDYLKTLSRLNNPIVYLE